MIIQVDSREKDNQYILDFWDSVGQKYKKGEKLMCGDYSDVLNHSICVDKKSSGSGLLEVAQNVCQDHKRFIAEIERANEFGIRLIFLLEEENIKCLEDVKEWQNPRFLKWVKIRNCQSVGKMKNYKISKIPPINGDKLYKILNTIQEKYGCEFLFDKKENMGKRIMELLERK
jgi:hypothetical protein